MKVSSIVFTNLISMSCFGLEIIILCPVLRDPRNGKVRVGGRNPGDRADYSCNDGFKLKGAGWRKCQGNGQWTGEAPTCES